MSKGPFASEADLCAAFIAHLEKGWTAYPETAGWDILLVRDSDGFQVGVEAKLRLNAKVISQALEAGQWMCAEAGPDCRAVLVPDGTGRDFEPICAYIGLTIIKMRSWEGDACYWSVPYDPPLPVDTVRFTSGAWRECCPIRRYDLPAYVPDVPAGASGPVQLTDWKIKAIKIAVILEKAGFVTRLDFNQIRIDIRLWLPGRRGWLAPTEQGFVAGRSFPDFRAQHPQVYEQIAADADDWMPPAAAEQAKLLKQGA